MERRDAVDNGAQEDSGVIYECSSDDRAAVRLTPTRKKVDKKRRGEEKSNELLRGFVFCAYEFHVGELDSRGWPVVTDTDSGQKCDTHGPCCNIQK